MNHPDKYLAKRYDTPNRSKAFTDIVYDAETRLPGRKPMPG